MTSLINDNKVAFFLLAVVIVALLTILVFSIVTHGNSYAFDITTMRYCASSGGVCTGV